MKASGLVQTAALLALAGFAACRAERKTPPSPPPSGPAVETADVERIPSSPAHGRRVIWLGLDGADWEYLDTLSAQGKIPNWSRLASEGFRANLKSFVPILSPVVWTTQETGVGPDLHRVLDFQEVDPATGALVPVSEASRKSPAVWNIASQFGRKVGVVGFWATHPAEKVNGFFLSDRIDPIGSPSSKSGVAFPVALEGAVRRAVERDGKVSAAELGPFLSMPQPEIASHLKAGSGMSDPVEALSKIVGSTRVTHRLARELYDRERPDFLAAYFEGTDQIGHLFAPYAAPRLSCTDEGRFETYRRVPENYFRIVDAMLGQWMRRAREDGAVLVITSDHGFKWGADRPCDLPAAVDATAPYWHREDGVFLAWGNGVSSGVSQREPTAFDIAPTLLALLNLPADAKMPGAAIPVLRGLHPMKKEVGLIARIPVETVPAAPPDAREANEYAKKLIALGYLSPKQAGDQPPAAGRAPGLTKGAYNNLGIYLRFTANDLSGARAAWEHSLKLDPNYHSPMFNIATLEHDRDNFREATRWLLRALAAGQPEPEKTAERWAGDFERKKRGAGADLLQALREAYPQSEVYARDYALILTRAQRCPEAEAVVAPLESSNDPETLNVAAIVETCLDRPDRVGELLRKSLALNPNQPRVREAIESLPR